jgi:hypothetical protein
MVPSSRHRHVQQLANMLRNKSMPLKLENIIVFTILAVLRHDALLTYSRRTMPVCLRAVGPFAQAIDKAQQEEEEEHADHNLRKVTFERRKKGLRSSTKMDFMRC